MWSPGDLHGEGRRAGHINIIIAVAITKRRDSAYLCAVHLRNLLDARLSSWNAIVPHVLLGRLDGVAADAHLVGARSEVLGRDLQRAIRLPLGVRKAPDAAAHGERNENVLGRLLQDFEHGQVAERKVPERERYVLAIDRVSDEGIEQ